MPGLPDVPQVAPPIDFGTVIMLTVLTMLIGFCVGYFLFIRPAKKAVKEEEEREYNNGKIESKMVPQSELPHIISDAELDNLREKKTEPQGG